MLHSFSRTHNSHLATDRHGPVKDAVHTQNGRLRGVDDGCAEHGAKHPTVADGKRATIHVFNSKLIFTSLGNTTNDSTFHDSSLKKIKHVLSLAKLSSVANISESSSQ